MASTLPYTRFVPRTGMRPNEGRVLVVDDDPQIRRVMRTTLDAKGYDVDEAGTGEQALELARTEKYDLIILDINLPGKSGVETCREIHTTSSIPIIMLTVRDAGEDKIEALDAGACDYVTKPFAMGELLARIRAVLRRTPSSGISGFTRTMLPGSRSGKASTSWYPILAYRKARPSAADRERSRLEPACSSSCASGAIGGAGMLPTLFRNHGTQA